MLHINKNLNYFKKTIVICLKKCYIICIKDFNKEKLYNGTSS